jgi:hypothetical protein
MRGLFPPGLGIEAYAKCCTAVLAILPWLLPTSNIEILAAISAVLSASRNGYDLLWRVLELFIPGFDPTIPIAQPQWTWDSTILEFSQGHLLYFCLQAKKHVFFTTRYCTNIFLRAIVPLEYAYIVSTLQTSVDTYCHPDKKWSPPRPDPHQQDRDEDPYQCQTQGSGYPHSAGASGGWHSSWDHYDADELAFCHVQG